MGCATSRVDDLPAVALCRERLGFLNDAIRFRCDLAEAHGAYLRSLKSVGSSLHRFFDHHPCAVENPPSPLLNLPPAKKKGDLARGSGPSVPAAARHSDSNSESHHQLHSDSDDGDASSGSLHHSAHFSSLHNRTGHLHFDDQEALRFFAGGKFGGGDGRFMHMNFMKSRATPSVSYEQRPMNPETGHMSEVPYYYNKSSNQSNGGNSSSFFPYDGFSNYEAGRKGYLSMQPPYASSSSGPSMAPVSPYTSDPPPPPPSPPKSSQWDYFNLFENDQNAESSYPASSTPSRNSRDVREEEGIPDLEDEEYPQDVAKAVHGTQKYVDVGSGGAAAAIYSKTGESSDPRANDEEALYQSRSSASTVEEELKHEVPMVNKKIVDDQKSVDRGNVGDFKGPGGLRSVFDVFREIQVQFDRASESGIELSGMLEVGCLPYRKNATNQVSSKMLHLISPSLALVSSQPSASKEDHVFDDDLEMRSARLASTLRKCYLWEKKLYVEVKAEEKLRLIHERKCRKLKRLEDRGAESHRIVSTRTIIRNLHTKIQIAIQVVDKISVNINKLRNKELWPRTCELIQGLTRMWKSMLECHRSQYQVIKEAKNLKAIAPQKNHPEAMMELEQDLIDWTIGFYSWIHAQKAYVRALNSWLLKCLRCEPEATTDGLAPFSPGRMGAPPLFVICNQWCQTLERVSEKEVVDSIRVLAVSVLRLWKAEEMNQVVMVNKDLERKGRGLDYGEQRIQKGILALQKMADDDGLSLADQASVEGDGCGDLQGSLQRIFEAMERLAAGSVNGYEELLQRSEDVGRVAREQGQEQQCGEAW